MKDKSRNPGEQSRRPATALSRILCGAAFSSVLGSTLVVSALPGCAEPKPETDPRLVFDLATVEAEFEEVVPCKKSHEHDLRHVRIVADERSADIFKRCVTQAGAGRCVEEAFPKDSLFVKYEYEHAGCKDNDLVSYTATLKLEPGSYEAGRDWHWQRASRSLEVEADGAPDVCLRCHINHCDEPHGFDLRCLPD
ncbi:MAG: hypothetical protein RJA70_1115 [Pseudomonadota bacterium]|jgi:hypothetical protein